MDFIVINAYIALLEITPTNFIPSKTFNSGFQIFEVRFTNKNSQPWEIEDRIDLTLVIKKTAIIKMRYLIGNPEIECM